MIDAAFLKGRLVWVIGLGKSGTATAGALGASGVRVLAWDDNEATRSAAASLGIEIADPLAGDLAKADLVVWSPGIPHSFPKPHPVAEKARALNVPLVCDVDLLARARPKGRFFGVTGTNGKSTTTTLLAHVLAAGGGAVSAGGNLGTPALAMDDAGERGAYVLELSSYQLELVPSLTLNAACLLNITPDHLARHGGMDGYIAAKRSVFDRLGDGGTAVIAVDDQYSARMAQDLAARGLNVVPISSAQILDKGVSAANGILREDGRVACEIKGFPKLPGRHNWQNAAAAYAMARAAGLDRETITKAFATYDGLAHRQELVATIDGVAYINDSKATNADAAEKALVCYQHIHWIIGGQMKEGGIASLAEHFGRIEHAYLIGDAAEAFAVTLDGRVAYTRCGTLDVALDKARQAAEPGSVVLLSPACASWDQFKSFEHRGDCFREQVLTFKAGSGR